MKVVYIAEIVGKPGIFALKSLLPALRLEFSPDLIWGCADGATGGFGLGKNHAFYLNKLGLKVLTLGECAFYKKDLPPLFPASPFLLRPANLPSAAPGRGWRFVETPAGKLAVVSLIGQSGFNRAGASSPFSTAESLLEKVRAETSQIFIDFHACTTAEKNTLFHHLKGRVSAVLGSHTKVATADARLLSGTAVMTDVGRTGSQTSVSGFLPDREIQRYLTGIPERSEETWASLAVQGVFIETNDQGQAVAIKPFHRVCHEAPQGSDKQGE